MKATSISINLPFGCNLKCPFCITRLTPKFNFSPQYYEQMRRAFVYARYHGVDTVLITSKGEPLLNARSGEIVRDVAEKARGFGFPIVELQTNGKAIAEKGIESALLTNKSPFTHVSISIADIEWQRSSAIMGDEKGFNYWDAVREVLSTGAVCRLSLNMINSEKWTWGSAYSELVTFVDKCLKNGVHQLTLRELGLPMRWQRFVDDEMSHGEVAVSLWIEENRLSTDILNNISHRIDLDHKVVRHLSYGPPVYDFRGISLSIASCMTETDNPEEVRSLIFQPDGHVYSSWVYKGSILL
jgi:molybdenum cofactor biosynthesis enzyme MoaA